MPTVTTDGTTLYYELAGDGDDQPTVVFVPDAASGPWLWGWQAPSLTGPYRTLVYAPRGTDGSDSAAPYTVDRFAADLEAVLAAADVRRVHLVGAGLGAMVALRYAREYGRARSLALFGAAASGDRVDGETLATLHPADPTRLRESLSLAFSDRFFAETGLIDRIVEWRREEDATGEARTGHLEAVRSFEAGPPYELTLPTLVCHGVDDPVVSLDSGKELAEDLPRGRFEPVEGKRFCFVEHATAVTDAIADFIDETAADDG
ncbi:alpha/beta hydrolase [Natronomonas gomsonensis]|jgi:3-oxoadipate enol-lactonase|uniref:alpha/beta fold hydrolase n=1 Tax=Natronomonas gomsonensis TaxID=1046043 RepID=UPI0020CA7C20|nr:alpha/beta hydrolase [Natronomonas gomsonensis]MCY4729556.1 alpha/beta hydrolase [Natronomonas gomsonensis]